MQTSSSNSSKQREEIPSPVSKDSEWNSTSISIVLVSFINHFIILGIIYSFGVYQQFYVQNIKLANSSLVAIIGAINVGCLSGLGIPAGRLAERFGFRTMSIIGTIIIALGLILASFSSELWHFIVTQGIITGIGSSIAYFPAVSAPAYYFSKYRGLAVGLAVSGSGLGGFVISIVLARMLDSLGLQWTLRICSIFAFGIISDNLVVLCASSWFLKIPKQDTANPTPSFPSKLLKDPAFILLALMPSLAAFGYLVPIVYSPLYATSKLSLSASDGALSAALFNAASTVGRIAIGSLADLAIGRLNAFVLCIFLSGLSIMVIWPLANSFGYY